MSQAPSGSDNLCVGFKKNGDKCNNKKKIGNYCGVHIKGAKEEYIKGLAITVTYSEVVENHVGMQKIGNIEQKGFQLDDLTNAKNNFEKVGAICELVHLNEGLKGTEFECKADDAYVLVIRGGVNILLKDINKNYKDMLTELTSFEWDTQALMRGTVKNKQARHNVCFGDFHQAPDIINGKGNLSTLAVAPLEP